jgi:hypothetical protein
VLVAILFKMVGVGLFVVGATPEVEELLIRDK